MRYKVKLLSRTTEVATIFDQGLAALAAATEATQAAGESARDTMATAREAMDIARGLSEESREQLAVQKEVSEAARRTWDAQASLLEEMQANLGRLATDLGDKIIEFRTASAQKITEVFHVFDSEMAKVVEHLGGTLAQLRDVTEELPGTVGGLRDTAQHLADAGQVQRNSLAEGLRAFEEAKAEIVEKLEHTRSDLRDLGSALPAFAKAADALQRGIEAMVDGMDTTRARSEEDFGRLVHAMQTGSERIADVVGSVGGSLKPVAEWTAEAPERLVVLSEHAEALAKALGGLRVTVSPPAPTPSPGRVDTQGRVPPARGDARLGNAAPPTVAGPPVTGGAGDTNAGSRGGVDAEAGRDEGHSADATDGTEAPRGWWRRLRGRRR